MGVTGLRNFVMAIRKLVLTLVSLEVVSWARAEKNANRHILSSWSCFSKSCLSFYMHLTNQRFDVSPVVIWLMWPPYDVNRSLLCTYYEKFWKEIDDLCLKIAELTSTGWMTFPLAFEPPWVLLKISMVEGCVSCLNILSLRNTFLNNRYQIKS